MTTMRVGRRLTLSFSEIYEKESTEGRSEGKADANDDGEEGDNRD